MTKPGYVANQQDLAAAFGVAVQTVSLWSRRPDSPSKEADGYRLADWIAWYLDFKSKPRGSSQSSVLDDDSDEPKDWQGESLRWLAKKRELEVRRLDGELVLLSKVEEMLATRATVFRSELERMARQLSPTVATLGDWRAIERAILEQLHEIMRKYSAPLPADLTTPDLDDSEDDEDPKPKKKKRAKKKRGRLSRKSEATAG